MNESELILFERVLRHLLEREGITMQQMKKRIEDTRDRGTCLTMSDEYILEGIECMERRGEQC